MAVKYWSGWPSRDGPLSYVGERADRCTERRSNNRWHAQRIAGGNKHLCSGYRTKHGLLPR